MPARPLRSIPLPAPQRMVEDDSDRLRSDSRLILIVEDDPPFATILRDMAHELGFQCIVTHTANDALAAVATYRPKAILLDMNPDRAMAQNLRATIEREGDRLADLHLWRLGPGHLGAIVSIVTATRREADYYRARLASFRALSHLTIEIVRQ